MLEQVENKIQELKKLRAEEYYKKKDADLRAWGLTTKVDGKKVTAQRTNIIKTANFFIISRS